MSDFEYALRFAGEDDKPFVFDHWWRELVLQPGVKHSRSVSAEDTERSIKAMMQRLYGRVTIACDAVDTTHCLGFIVADHPYIHWIHVKRDFRGMGIARDLIRSTGEGPYVATLPSSYAMNQAGLHKAMKRYGIHYDMFAMHR